MAGRTLMTLDVRELIRRLRAGESNRAVARALSIARQTVVRYREIAGAQGWLSGEMPALDALDRQLLLMMAPSHLPRQPFKAASHRVVIERLDESKLSYISGSPNSLPVERAVSNSARTTSRTAGVMKFSSRSFARGRSMRDPSRSPFGLCPIGMLFASRHRARWSRHCF